MTKSFVMWSNFVMWINDKLFIVTNFAPCNKFLMNVVIYTVLTKIHFVAIYALLCGAKVNPKQCPWSKNDKYDVCHIMASETLISSTLSSLVSNSSPSPPLWND